MTDCQLLRYEVPEAVSHGGALNDSWYDTDSKLDSPSVVTSQRYSDAVSDELAPSDSDGLDSDHRASESSRGKFTDVDGCNGGSSPHTFHVSGSRGITQLRDIPRPRTNRPTIICATENDEQMIIAPTVNHTSPYARTHLRPILSASAPEDRALKHQHVMEIRRALSVPDECSK